MISLQDVGYAALQIIPTFKDLDRNLENGTSRAMTLAGSRGGTRFGDAAGRSAGHRFASVFGSIARAGVIGLLGGTAILGTAAFKLAGNSLEEARDAQKVGALTESVIKSTGAAAQVSARHVGDLAEALSNKSGIDDEVIQSGANVLLTFTKIRDEVGKNNDIFSQATELTADYAAFMAQGKGGIDLKSAAIQVGKALNDPIKGVTALGKAGVQFTDSQREQIEALVESGDQMQAQKIILGELETQFGGAAEAQANLSDKVSVAWSNIQEKLGKAILPLVDDVQRAFLRKGVPAIEGWVDTFEKKGIPALKGFYDEAKPIAQDVLPEIADALGTVHDVTKAALPLALDLVEAFNDMPDWAKYALVGGAAAGSLGKKFGVGSLLGRSGLGAIASKAAPLPVFVTNPGFAADVPGGDSLPGSKWSKAARVAGGATLVGALGVETWIQGNRIADQVSRDAPYAMPGAGARFGGGVAVPGAGLSNSPLNNALTTAASMGLTAQRGDYRAGLEQAAAEFAKFPRKLQTEIVLHGAPETQKEMHALLATYDLTPKQKRTAVELWGADNSSKVMRDYIGILAGVPKTKGTQIYLTGVESARQQIASLAASIHALPSVGDHSLPFVSGGAGGRTVEREERTPVKVDIDGKQFDAHLTERVRSVSKGEKESDGVFSKGHVRGYVNG